MSTVISVENLSKAYRLGQIGTGTFSYDLKLWWAKVRGKPNPLLKIGEEDYGNHDSESIWALKDVSFTVEQGEVLGIIGRNGAGKSTLLKILSRVTAPTSGRIKVKGRVASLLEVGTGFHPDLTGRENIYLNGAILGMSRKEIDRKFDEIVDFAEVENFIDTPVKRYSSGMYVRLAFAVAAHLEPEILVVDEVLAVGDMEFQKKCLGKMGDVAKAGRTVLFVSHNMTAISQLCTTCLLIHTGKIILNDKTNKVVAYYVKEAEKIQFSPNKIDTSDFALTDLKIFQEGITNPDLFITELPIIVEFAYEIKKELFGLRIGFDLVSKEHITLFRSFDDDVQGKRIKSPGKYKAYCRIPKSLLLPTKYYLYPRIGIHNVRWIYNDESGIEITLHSQNGVNSRYDGDRPGVILPRLEWKIEKMINRFSKDDPCLYQKSP
jgi:lipopolysaccharide transport system ATP-binding protein